MSGFLSFLNVLDAAMKHKTCEVKVVFPGIQLSVSGLQDLVVHIFLLPGFSSSSACLLCFPTTPSANQLAPITTQDPDVAKEST